MTQTTSTMIAVRKVLPITETTSYTEADLHLEVMYPDGTVKWLENTEITFTVVNAVQDVSVGSLTCTGTMTDDGRYKFTIYNGTFGGQYTKIGSVYVNKLTNAVYADV